MNNIDGQIIKSEFDSREEPNKFLDFFYHVATMNCDALDLEAVDPNEDIRPPIHIEFIKQEDPEEFKEDDRSPIPIEFIKQEDSEEFNKEDNRPSIHIEFIKQEDPEEFNKEDDIPNEFEPVKEDHDVKIEDSFLADEEKIENEPVKCNLNIFRSENKKNDSEVATNYSDMNNTQSAEMSLNGNPDSNTILKLAEKQLTNPNLVIILPPIVLPSTFVTPSLNSAEKEKEVENETDKTPKNFKQDEPPAAPEPVDHSDRVALRSKIVELLEAGKGVNEIGRILGVHRNTVSNWKLRWKKERDLQDRPRCGAPRKTTKEQDEKIVEIFKNFPLTTCKEIVNNLKLPVSRQAIRKRLHTQDQTEKERHS